VRGGRRGTGTGLNRGAEHEIREDRRSSLKWWNMDNEIILAGMFLGSGLLAYVIIPGLLVI
jgi:hypothetical protein